MMEELSAYEGKNEDKLANNENKFLALMPPPDRLQGCEFSYDLLIFIPLLPCNRDCDFQT